MKLLSIIAICTIIATAANAQSSTFQNPIEGELYTEAIQPELYCLAMNIYHEARAELSVGQYAVADVTINRVFDTRYPNTICEVVRDGKQHPNGQMKRNKCQFSWYCDGRSDEVHDTDRWRQAQEVAYRIVKENKFRGATEGATHYHATYVSPAWRHQLDLVGLIGAHIFYRWN
jgi:spore germination cell wall hydrolase CwlJ-like protein|tara:strand:- start:336 stop:857 length:522 start_codon:yes stop_codon:yes gene_type:complete